jgi:hypothetical protein
MVMLDAGESLFCAAPHDPAIDDESRGGIMLKSKYTDEVKLFVLLRNQTSRILHNQYVLRIWCLSQTAGDLVTAPPVERRYDIAASSGNPARYFIRPSDICHAKVAPYNFHASRRSPCCRQSSVTGRV